MALLFLSVIYIFPDISILIPIGALNFAWVSNGLSRNPLVEPAKVETFPNVSIIFILLLPVSVTYNSPVELIDIQDGCLKEETDNPSISPAVFFPAKVDTSFVARFILRIT